MDPFLEPLNLCFLTTVPCVSSVLPCQIVFFSYYLGTFSASIFVLIFECILDAFLTHFGYRLDTKCRKETVKNQSKKCHRKKVVPGRSDRFRREPSWGPEGPIIKEVWLFRRFNYSRIQIFRDLVIQIFGIVFGGAAVRKNVLHADPVGRRI